MVGRLTAQLIYCRALVTWLTFMIALLSLIDRQKGSSNPTDMHDGLSYSPIDTQQGFSNITAIMMAHLTASLMYSRALVTWLILMMGHLTARLISERPNMPTYSRDPVTRLTFMTAHLTTWLIYSMGLLVARLILTNWVSLQACLKQMQMMNPCTLHRFIWCHPLQCG